MATGVECFIHPSAQNNLAGVVFAANNPNFGENLSKQLPHNIFGIGRDITDWRWTKASVDKLYVSFKQKIRQSLMASKILDFCLLMIKKSLENKYLIEKVRAESYKRFTVIANEHFILRNIFCHAHE